QSSRHSLSTSMSHPAPYLSFIAPSSFSYTLLSSFCLFLFFFLMLPPPPRSTLFPYTTLFRSFRYSFFFRRSVCSWKRLHNQHVGDRKSTRLNSSHEWISYAVFCLKKKKKK